jgi:hypothetical protein
VLHWHPTPFLVGRHHTPESDAILQGRIAGSISGKAENVLLFLSLQYAVSELESNAIGSLTDQRLRGGHSVVPLVKTAHPIGPPYDPSKTV